MSVLKISGKAQELISYGDNKTFASSCNPIALGKKYLNIRTAGQALAITDLQMKHVIEAYDIETASVIIEAYIALLQKYLGVKDESRLDNDAIQELASFILEDYKQLNISELDLVFKNIKKGKYGSIYGRIDPVFIMASFKSYFDRERLETLRSITEVDTLGWTIENIDNAKEFLKNEENLQFRLKKWKTYLCKDCQGTCKSTAEMLIAKETLNRYIVSTWILCWDIDVECGEQYV